MSNGPNQQSGPGTAEEGWAANCFVLGKGMEVWSTRPNLGMENYRLKGCQQSKKSGRILMNHLCFRNDRRP
ncbi:hypothetical protein HanRHA438_Chr07g0307441 [Helianthus annuus]|nr:hypothetical protein HanRHA438_Chr07g0307441 [Helianthus annuus]